jgi:hypothetical protein
VIPAEENRPEEPLALVEERPQHSPRLLTRSAPATPISFS